MYPQPPTTTDPLQLGFFPESASLRDAEVQQSDVHSALEDEDCSCLLTEPIQVVVVPSSVIEKPSREAKDRNEKTIRAIAEYSNNQRLITLWDYYRSASSTPSNPKTMYLVGEIFASFTVQFPNTSPQALQESIDHKRATIERLRQEAYDKNINYLGCLQPKKAVESLPTSTLQALADRAAEKGVLARFQKRLEGIATLVGKTLSFATAPQEAPQESISTYSNDAFFNVAFWQWFGDSQAVDENGMPLKFYTEFNQRLTPHSEAARRTYRYGEDADETFPRRGQFRYERVYPNNAPWVNRDNHDYNRLGMMLYRVPLDGSSTWIHPKNSETGDYDERAYGNTEYPVYVQSENPFDLRNPVPVSVLESIAKQAGGSLHGLWKNQTFNKSGYNYPGGYHAWRKNGTCSDKDMRDDGYGFLTGWFSVVGYFAKAGYDGIRLPKGEWMIFKESQVKSAIANDGTFDSNDPNFLSDQAHALNLQPLADRAAEKGVLPRFRKRLEDIATLFGTTLSFATATQDAPQDSTNSYFNDAFWRWFEDSQAVDENGLPLKFYVDSRQKLRPIARAAARRYRYGETSEDLAAYSPYTEEAVFPGNVPWDDRGKQYIYSKMGIKVYPVPKGGATFMPYKSSTTGDYEEHSYGNTQYPVYIQSKNAFDLRNPVPVSVLESIAKKAGGEIKHLWKVQNFPSRSGYNYPGGFHAWRKRGTCSIDDMRYTSHHFDYLGEWFGTEGYFVKAGYDGIRLPQGVWIVFKESQVKSAIANDGTFDSNDPNFLSDQAHALNLQPLAIRAAEKGILHRLRKRLEDIATLIGTKLALPAKSVDELVEERLREQQRSKEFQDSEGRIKGSRKEQSAYSVVRSQDLAELEEDAYNASRQVVKEKVFPKFDVSALRESGVSSGTAYFMVKLREAIVAQPGDSPKERLVYVTLCEIIRSLCTGDYTYTNPMSNSVDETTYQRNYNFLKEYVYDLRLGREVRFCTPETLTVPQIKSFQDITRLRNLINDTIEQKKDQDPSCSVVLPFMAEVLKHRLREMEHKVTKKKNGKSWTETHETSSLYEYVMYVLGKEFRNLLSYNRDSDAVARIWRQAEKYEAVPQETQDREFQRWVERQIKWKEQLRINMELERTFFGALKLINDSDEAGTMLTRNNVWTIEVALEGTKGFAKEQGLQFPQYEKKARNDFEEEIDLMKFKTSVKAYIQELQNREEQYNTYLENTVGKRYPIDFQSFAKEYPNEVAHPDDWSWYETPKTTTTKPKVSSGEPRINSGIPLKNIVRKGGLAIDDVSVAAIKRIFGFKEVEFGNYVKDTEAREHVRHFLGAIADLCEILNLHPHDIHGLLGLSIAFGSRGKGGKAIATYNAGYTIINLTKKRGDGTIAHEWGHFFDNACAGSDQKGKRYFMSEHQHDQDFKFASPIRYAMQELFEEIQVGKSTNKITFQAVSSRGYSIKEFEKMESIEKALEVFKQRYPIYFSEERLNRASNGKKLRKQIPEIMGQLATAYNVPSVTVEFETVDTVWYAASKQMQSPYWASNVELFARAFETYVYEKLKRAGRENNYLVSGKFHLYKNTQGKCLYPEGKEREDLISFFDKLISKVKEGYKLRDFEPFTDKRTNETAENLGETDPEDSTDEAPTE